MFLCTDYYSSKGGSQQKQFDVRVDGLTQETISHPLVENLP